MKFWIPKCLILLLSGILLVSNLYSQNIRHLTTNNGLNNGAINDIVQDSTAYIWLATWDGITRYDGYTLKNYRPQPGNPHSLPARQVFKLYVDSQNNLWALTYMGISRYNRQKDQFDHVILEGFGDRYNLSPNNDIIFEENGVLYYKNLDQLYYHKLGSDGQETKFSKLNIQSDQFSSNYRIAYFNEKLFLLKYYGQRDESVLFRGLLTGLGDGMVLLLEYYHSFEGEITRVLSIDPESSIVVIDNTVCQFTNRNERKETALLMEDLVPQEMLLSSDNKLWMIPQEKGLGCLDLHSGIYELYDYDETRKDLLLGNQLSSLFEDFSGNLWIGHSGEGLSILNLNQKAFETYRNIPGDPNSLSCNSVMAFAEFKDGVLIGTDYEGVSIMSSDPKSGANKFSSMSFPEEFWSPPSFRSIWSIVKENDELFWMAGNFGLIRADYQEKRWELEQYSAIEYATKLRKIVLDKSNNIWLGTYDGLVLYPFAQRDSMGHYLYLPDPANPNSIADINIIDILIDSKDRLWIGTRDRGVNLLKSNYSKLNLSSHTAPELNFQKFTADTSSGSLNNNEINCLFEYYDGSIWAGTQGGGINIIHPQSGEVEYLTREDGLPGSNVFGILSDEQGNLWVSTNRGLCSITTFGDSRQITSYNPSDGIQGNVFMVHSYYKGAKGMLYFGGRNGFTRFYPSEISQNLVPPKIILSDLKLFDHTLSVGEKVSKKTILHRTLNETDTLTLSYKNYNIRIGVAAVHFQDPGENRIEYKLEGFDREWNSLPSEERFINYSNLDPGWYKLQIKAANSDNVWTPDIRTLYLHITPPWYRTWYGYLLFFFIISAAIYSLFRLLVRQQVLKHKIRLDEKQMENIKQMNEGKLKFFTNISHELRTPLSLVLSPIEYIYKNKELSSEVKEQLSLSLRNAKMLKRLISNIIDFRKFDAGKIELKLHKADLKLFIQNIGKNFEILQTSDKIKLIYQLPDERTLADFDPGKMEQVMYNLLSNAFKHTRAEGTILISLDIREEQVHISVFNEGPNIPEEHLDKIFDRFHQVNNKREGSGIGLSVASSLVQLHKGELKVRNIDSNGVEFRISMPRFSDQELPEAADSLFTEAGNDVDLRNNASLAPTKPEGKQAGEKELKLVVIEDNHELRSFYKTLLSDLYQFYEAENGALGIKLVEEILPDLVISDVVMPEKNGYELCSHIKEQMHTCHIPVILLTARGAPEQITQGYRSGADAYVTKPFENEVLLSQINSLIENRELVRNKYCSVEYSQEEDKEDRPLSKDDRFMQILNEDIESNLFNEDYNVVALSQKLNISRNHLYRKVKALTGFSTVEYIRIRKLNKAAELLKTRQYSIKEVCYKTGFRDQSYFTKSFKNHFKLNPTEYIKTHTPT